MAKLTVKGNNCHFFYIYRMKYFKYELLTLKLIIYIYLFRFRHALTTFCDKFTPKEVNEAFDHCFIDDKGRIDIESLINMLTGKGEEDD